MCVRLHCCGTLLELGLVNLHDQGIYLSRDLFQQEFASAVNQCEYEFENANCDVGHTYGIHWKWNNWHNFHFHFNYHLAYFQLKNKFSWNFWSFGYPHLANNTYFIQWIITSHHIIKMAIGYIETILCAPKLHVLSYSVQIQLMLQNTSMLSWISCKSNVITPIKKLDHPFKSMKYTT